MRKADGQLRKETGRTFCPGAMLEIKAALEHARDEADVLGILYGGETGMSELYAPCLYRARGNGQTPAALASSYLHHEILADLPALVAGRRVSAISCRNVKPVIEGKWGLDDVRVYQVPSQYMVRDIDDEYEATLHETPIWPDAHERVRSELTVRERGEVFLVGAGLFGKDLCIEIRDQGGIALDMGSALDHIAGKLVRVPVRRIFALHASGMSAPEIASAMRNRFDVQVSPDRIRELIDSVSPYLR